jgi:hypothetical protein
VNFTTTLMAAVLAVASTSASAFVNLPRSEPLRVLGDSSPTSDQLFLFPGAFDGSNFALPPSLSMLAFRETTFQFPVSRTDLRLLDFGVVQDAVFRDSTDNRLVFGTRVVMDPALVDAGLQDLGFAPGTGTNSEANDIFRYGFDGFDVAVAWTPATANDLRMFSGAFTNTGRRVDGVGLDANYDPNAIGMGTDVSIDEGNPQTGWFLNKVLNDNVGFAVFANAIGINEERARGVPTSDPTFNDLPRFLAQVDGFAPVVVPVPAAVWLLGSAIAGMAGVARRRTA